MVILLTQNEFAVLKSILDRKDQEVGMILTKGTTTKDMIAKTGLSKTKIYSTISKLSNLGYIEMALKVKNANSYRLTDDGIRLICEISGKIKKGEEF